MYIRLPEGEYLFDIKEARELRVEEIIYLDSNRDLDRKKHDCGCKNIDNKEEKSCTKMMDENKAFPKEVKMWENLDGDYVEEEICNIK